MEKLKIKYFTDQIAHLEYIEGKSDWIDLRASEDVELKKGEFKLVPLGIAVKLPDKSFRCTYKRRLCQCSLSTQNSETEMSWGYI